jgi:4-amino-4-deoxy-L-arabinose transferase-like glycosyltransferase/nucleoid-associated protein YgaU
MTDSELVQASSTALLYPPIAVAPRLTTAARLKLARLNAEIVLVVSLMVVGLFAHGINMFQYPSFTWLADEGTYVSEAWAVVRTGQLAHYTYMYGHVPGGWILLAAFTFVLGGPRALDMPIDVGRVLMLVLHVLMVPLLYRLARRLGCPPAAAAFAAFVFSMSPLAIYYQRMFLLDNVMLFWTILSLVLLLDDAGRLSRVALSGSCFALALLSKETDVTLLPAVLFMVWSWRREHQRKFAIVAWLMPMVILTSWYPLYAILKNELLPESFAIHLLGQTVSFGDSRHVSLLEALAWQGGRGGGGLFDLNNAFFVNARMFWLPKDTILLAAGALAVGCNVVRGFLGRSRPVFAAGILGLMPILYLIHGGIVFQHYILYAIPFFCLNLAMVLSLVVKRLSVTPGAVLVGAIATLLLGAYWQTGALQPLFTVQASKAPRDAIVWMKQNLPATSVIIARDSWWTDFHEPGLGGGVFPYVEDQWQVDSNPDVYDTVLHQDWHSVDYLLMLPDMLPYFQQANDPIGLAAYSNACLFKTWQPDDGDTIQLWKVDKSGALASVPHGNASPTCANLASPPPPAIVVPSDQLSRHTSITKPVPSPVATFAIDTLPATTTPEIPIEATPTPVVRPAETPAEAAIATNRSTPLAPTPIAIAPATVTPVDSGGGPLTRTYVIRSGDTLMDIAITFYGTTDAWRDIAAANADQLPNPDRLQIGQRLTLPPTAT